MGRRQRKHSAILHEDSVAGRAGGICPDVAVNVTATVAGVIEQAARRRRPDAPIATSNPDRRPTRGTLIGRHRLRLDEGAIGVVVETQLLKIWQQLPTHPQVSRPVIAGSDGLTPWQ